MSTKSLCQLCREVRGAHLESPKERRARVRASSLQGAALRTNERSICEENEPTTQGENVFLRDLQSSHV